MSISARPSPLGALLVPISTAWRRMLDALPWLVSPPYTEICPLCRPGFSNDPLSAPDSSLFGDSPAARAQQARCHGCFVLDFAATLMYLLLYGDGDGGRDRGGKPPAHAVHIGMYATLSPHSFMGLHAEDEAGRRTHSVYVEIFKTTSALPQTGGGLAAVASPAAREVAQGWNRGWQRGWLGLLASWGVRSITWRVLRPNLRLWRQPWQVPPAPVYVEQAYEAQVISGDTGSAHAFETAFAWVEACLSGHAACRGEENEKPPVLPTRVIDIRNDSGLRLVETGGHARARYLCLSHRWIDPARMPRCTRGNIAALQRHIPWEDLTQTFRETVVFARAFSAWYASRGGGGGSEEEEEAIRYVWIDSLCIVQDDPDDWAREAARMCSIYENATLTVAAAAGGDGCFRRADRLHTGLEVTCPRRPDPRLYLRRPLPHYGLGTAVLPFDSVDKKIDGGEDAPLELLRRGWVFQERLLSRRYLVFSPLELIWECLECNECECGYLGAQNVNMGRRQQPTEGEGKGLDDKDNSRGSGSQQAVAESGGGARTGARDYWKTFFEGMAGGDPNGVSVTLPVKVAHAISLSAVAAAGATPAGGDGTAQKWWRRLVEDYSRTALTKTSDRLPALAGLVAQFSRASGPQSGRYLAGMWTASLLSDLTWCYYSEADPDGVVEAGGKTEEEKEECGTPSWSWVSCGRPVRFAERILSAAVMRYAEVVRVPLSSSGEETTGRTDLGSPLVLRGIVYAGPLSLPDEAVGAAPAIPPDVTLGAEYNPDRPMRDITYTSSFRISGHKGVLPAFDGADRFMLMSRHDEAGEKRILWVLLHLRPAEATVAGASRRFRRRGVLVVGFERESTATTEEGEARVAVATDAVVDGCFTAKEAREVELV